jgi:tRNA A37 threonylcarbamoyltransferase TsaD
LLNDKLDIELNILNVIPRLIDRSEFKLPTCEEIEFIASHFSEFSFSSLSTVCLNELSAIVSHPSLKMKEDVSFFSLFEFVRFENLSSTTISDFLKVVCEHF